MLNTGLFDAASGNILVITLIIISFVALSEWSHSQYVVTYKVCLGLIFGLFACIGMLMPVHITDGVILDSRVPIITMAGVFLGPLGAAIAAMPPMLLRIDIGGGGVYAGLASMTIALIVGCTSRYFIQTRANGIIQHRHILVIAATVSPVSLLSFLLLPMNLGTDLMMNTVIYTAGLNFFSSLILGYMLTMERQRQVMIAELSMLKEKAEDIIESKSLFMARMSHELRTPMNSIIGFSDLLRSTPLNDQQRYFLQQIKTAGRTMTQLINDILDFSKIEVGKISLEHTPFNLAKMIESCGSLVEPDAQEKGLYIKVSIDPLCPEWVMADELRLRQILMNLLSNAVKFTDAGGITLSVVVAEKAPDHYKISFNVEDTGIGIPENRQSLVFNAFEQADPTLTRKHGGSGLGLSIACHLTSLMQGTMTLSSEPGQGALFTVTLPLTQADGVIDADEAVLEPRETNEVKKILIVEDIAMNRDLILAMLSKLGYQCMTAQNGEDAVEIAKKHSFDLIFMDLQMPIMNGYDATRYIRQDLTITSNQTLIVALTAHALPEEIAKCFEAGMDDFLTKPVEFLELSAKLDELLEGTTDSWDIPRRDSSTYENAPLLSEAELKNFLSFVGHTRLQEAYDDFVNDNAARMMMIRAKDSKDDIIRITLHNMTSTSGNLGMKKLSLYAQHLLDQGIARDRAAQFSEIDLLDSIFRESCKTFERFMVA